jgi:CHASE3 domain sensor protein
MKPLGRGLSNYWGNLAVRTKGLVVIALPLFAFIASTLLILGVRKMNTDATTWVRHSQEVRLEIRDFREMLLQAEDYARGYGLRDGQDWSKISERTRTTLLGKAASLTALVKDDPEPNGANQQGHRASFGSVNRAGRHSTHAKC